MNVVFSATRQWNPGDEFILFGCINALRSAGFEFNPIIFNRNPQTRGRRRTSPLIRGVDRALAGGVLGKFLDNSLKDDTDPAIIDAVVFAGSPEWHGRRLAPLYTLIDTHKKPALFLGIGSANDFTFDSSHFTATEMRVLRTARLITCREERTAAALASVGARHLTCPALLSCTEETPRRVVRRVGLMFGSDRAVRHNRVSPETFQYLDALYRRLMHDFGREIEFELVAHYIDELQHARAVYPTVPLRYSFDAVDYRDIYARYDLVVGHRIHGVGIAASQGIPGICVAHDRRGETARGFQAELVSVGQPVDEVSALFKRMVAQIGACSDRVIAHKRDVAEAYTMALREALPTLR